MCLKNGDTTFEHIEESHFHFLCCKLGHFYFCLVAEPEGQLGLKTQDLKDRNKACVVNKTHCVWATATVTVAA